jgi:hypothetical protein
MIRRRVGVATLLILLGSCGSDSITGSGNGAWIGDWIQVNFLTVDDLGVWDADDPSGIGFVARVTQNTWVLTDDYGNGCAVTMSYSVSGNLRFTRQATSLGPGCPDVPLALWQESGTLEFSEGDQVMIERFDLQSGDDIVAYKWVRQ